MKTIGSWLGRAHTRSARGVHFRISPLVILALSVAAVLPGGAVAATKSPASVVVDDTHTLGAVNRNLFGTNYPLSAITRYIDSSTRQPWSSLASQVDALNLSFVRTSPLVDLEGCGGVDCTYHWKMVTPGSPNFYSVRHGWQLSPDEWMQHIATIAPSSTPMVIVNIEAGTRSEAQDWVAYMNGSTTSVRVLEDGTTVGEWARLRQRNGHASPYGVRYWEMGNEEFDLHACFRESQRNGPHCVNHPPSVCLGLTNEALYGCIADDYGHLMKAVDPSISIVVGYMGQDDFSPVASRAHDVVSAIDLHQYPDMRIDPYGTTFDTDGQKAQYTFSETTTSQRQMVTVALWTSSAHTAHMDAYLDGGLVPMSSFKVFPSVEAPVTYLVKLKEVFAGTHTHTLSVVVCDSRSVNMANRRCMAKGKHPIVNLQHVTVTVGNVSARQLSEEIGCFRGVSELQNLNGPTPTSLVNTRVSVTSGKTGTSGDPGSPWRLANDDDFPVTFAAAQGRLFSSGISGYRAKLSYMRSSLAEAGFATTPLIVGEYGSFGGCQEEPVDLMQSQSAAIWTALITQALYSDRNAVQPIIGASEFQFGDGQIVNCLTFHMFSTILTKSSPCQGSNVAYPAPTGLVMQQFAHLAGSRVAAAVSNAPNVVSYRASRQPGFSMPSLTAVASMTGSTITIVLVNTCPTAQSAQCGGGVAPIQLSLASGAVPRSVSGTTVAALPYANNTDAAANAVTTVPLSPSISGRSVAVSLPPFSVSTITITI